jgi:hypothetical protein
LGSNCCFSYCSRLYWRSRLHQNAQVDRLDSWLYPIKTVNHSWWMKIKSLLFFVLVFFFFFFFLKRAANCSVFPVFFLIELWSMHCHQTIVTLLLLVLSISLGEATYVSKKQHLFCLFFFLFFQMVVFGHLLIFTLHTSLWLNELL